MSLRDLSRAMDETGKKARQLAKDIDAASAAAARFKVDVSKFDVDMSVMKQHAGQTVEEFNNMLNMIGPLKWALDGTEPKLKALDTSSKEAIDTLSKLNDLMDKKFPDVAKNYIENYRILIQDVLRGSETVDQAMEQLAALQAMLNRMGLTSGQMGQLDAFTNMFKQLLEMLRKLQDKSRP